MFACVRHMQVSVYMVVCVCLQTKRAMHNIEKCKPKSAYRTAFNGKCTH